MPGRQVGAALLVVALIVVPVYMLFVRDDGDSLSKHRSALLEAATDQREAAELLVRRVADPRQRIVIRYPRRWRGVRDAEILRVSSPDRLTFLAVTSKMPVANAPATFADAVKGIARGLGGATVSYPPASDQRPVAGLPAATAVLDGRGKKGAERTALVAVARGAHRAYVVTLITPPDSKQIETAQLILSRGLRLGD